MSLVVFALAFAGALFAPHPAVVAAEHGLTAPTCEGSLRQVSSTGQLNQALRDVRFGVLVPGSVVRLAATTFKLATDGEPLSLNNIAGTSEDCPITLEGAGSGALLNGNRYPDNEQFGHRLRVALVAGAKSLIETQTEILKLRSTGMPEEAPINCLKIERASWIVIQNINIAGCWPTAVYLRDAKYITVRNSTITGSTYAVIAHGDSHHLLIEGNRWTQDASGDVWAKIPWGVSHHGSKAHLNGALFGGYNIKGSVVIRGNLIRHAYNGIRIKSDCAGRALCDTNMNVEISDNTFEFIRDNSVEPEGRAINWWVRHNRMRDVHAPFSFDGVKGGPHYVFGNVGWFTEMPERECDDQVWADDREPHGTPTAHRECRMHRTGKTFKLGNAQEKPLHIFHNSWLVRSPLIGGGRSGPLKAWNNAIEFCEGEDHGIICRAPGYFLETLGKNKFSWMGRIKAKPTDHNIRYNVSNRPVFPASSKKPAFPVAGMWAQTIGFKDSRKGDFRLRGDSAARNSGCTIRRDGAGMLSCIDPPDRLKPDVGAFQGNGLFQGPAFHHADGAAGPDVAYVERPRVVDVAFNRADPARFAITMSVPVTLQSAVETVTLWTQDNTAPIAAMCSVNKAQPAALACVLPSDKVDESAVSAIDLPRTITRRDGQCAPLTLWASSDKRLRFAN
ncbi:MAG: hypothetical protein GY948_22075 [Alphaproteobacteria bacterium]|nr:hypothetical protein [Alphaproteobacteria bacterium]